MLARIRSRCDIDLWKYEGSGRALVAGQEVVITNARTRVKIKIKTDSAGHFGPRQLASGPYKREIRGQCFKRFSKSLEIFDGHATNLDATLVLSCPKDLGPVQ